MLSPMYRANGAMYGIIEQLKMNVSYLGGFILKTKVPPIFLMPKLLFWTGNWGQKFLLRHPGNQHQKQSFCHICVRDVPVFARVKGSGS